MSRANNIILFFKDFKSHNHYWYGGKPRIWRRMEKSMIKYRLAAIGITEQSRALELLLNLQPPGLIIKSTAAKGALRVSDTKIWRFAENG